MPDVLSYLTMNGREVSNSARLAAFAAAGLLPSQFDVEGAACGALVRAAQATPGTTCPYLGFWDPFAETTDLSIISTPAYYGTLNTPGTMSPVLQPSGTGSDGSIRQGVASFSVNEGFAPAQGGAWADGIVVVAADQWPTVVSGDNPKVTAYGRIGTGVSLVTANHPSVGDTYLGARLDMSSTLTVLRVMGFNRQTAGGGIVTTFASSATFVLPTGRVWVVLRMTGTAIAAELWTQDPRMGGQPYLSVPYTLSSTTQFQGSGLTEAQALGVPGYQGFGLENNPVDANLPKVSSPEWWSTPTCSYTAHLYPSPFLYPSPTLYPDEAGNAESILATTPWTDSGRPESAEFLGVYFDDIDGMDGNAVRSIDQRMGGLGGAALGQLIQQGRTLKFSGSLIASSCRGLDYGKEWLTDILSQACLTCPDAAVTIRTAVPTPDDGTNDSQGLYELYGVGLVDGPAVPPSSSRECVIADVTFTLVAGNGYKYRATTSLYGPTKFADVNGQALVTLPQPTGIGVNGAVIVLYAGSSDLTGVYPAEQLATYPAANNYPSSCNYPNAGGLPVTLPVATCPTGFNIPTIPAGYTLTIDGARHTIILTDPTGAQSDGTYLLSQATAQAIQWPEAEACDTNGFAISIGAVGYASDATITVYAKTREG